MHLIDETASLPSVEGLLVSRRHSEYLVALPSLLTSTTGNPSELESRWVAIPRDRVAFYEVL
jgi:hypothetical protein